MMPLLNTCAAAMLACTGGAATQQPQTYEITLHRPVEVGQRFSVVAEGAEQRNVTAVIDGNSQQLDHNELTIEFTADATIQTIDAHGRPTSIEYAIKRCAMTFNGTQQLIGSADATLLARWNDETGTTQYTLNGEPVSSNQAAALSLVTTVSSGAGPTNDEAFGTDDPQSVGSHWPINTAVIVDDLRADSSLPISEADVNGRSTLLGARTHEGTPCYMVSSRISLGNFVPGFEQLPRGFELKRAFVTTMFQGLFPEDASIPALQESMNMNLDAVLVGALGPDQPNAVLQITGTRTSSSRTTMLEPDEKVASGSTN